MWSSRPPALRAAFWRCYAKPIKYDESRASPEWLKLKPSLAPVKLGIFPLVNKEGMPEVGEKLYLDLRKDYVCQFDAKQ